MKTFLPIAYMKWEFLPFEKANLSIATHALHYWTWDFVWIRLIPYENNPNELLLFRIDKHTKRLSKSAKILWYDIGSSFIESIIIEFLKRNKISKSIYLRPLIYTSDLDIAPRLHDIEIDFLLYWLEMWDYLSNDWVTCTFSSWTRQQDSSFPLRGKITGWYITSALAKSEAKNRWFDEAILLTNKWKISEGSAMNIFLVKDNKIITPWVNQDILEWITRWSVIEIAKSLWYEVEEREVDKSELLLADEVFFTWTAVRIVPVLKIEQYELPKNHKIADEIKLEFEKIVAWKNKTFENWITRVCI
jgi:branched-chain amino acid aminotransferase